MMTIFRARPLPISLTGLTESPFARMLAGACCLRCDEALPFCRVDFRFESEFEEEEDDREGMEGRRLEEERRRVGMMRTISKLKLPTGS